jgi:hypothetical protein
MSILGRHFPGASVSPIKLFAAAALPTIIAIMAFRLLPRIPSLLASPW